MSQLNLVQVAVHFHVGNLCCTVVKTEKAAVHVQTQISGNIGSNGSITVCHVDCQANGEIWRHKERQLKCFLNLVHAGASEFHSKFINLVWQMPPLTMLAQHWGHHFVEFDSDTKTTSHVCRLHFPLNLFAKPSVKKIVMSSLMEKVAAKLKLHAVGSLERGLS